MFITTRNSLRSLKHYKIWGKQITGSKILLKHDTVMPALIKSTFTPEIRRCISCSSLRLCDNNKDPPHKQDGTTEYRDSDYRTKYPNPYKQDGTTEYRDLDYRTKYPNPIYKTFGIMRDDLESYFGIKKIKLYRNLSKLGLINPQNVNFRTKDVIQDRTIWPSTCDVLVIGGGAIGSSIAYHLKERALGGLNVVVVEQDSSYLKASTVLSVGGIRQQFSIPENIQLSLYGMQFLRNAPTLLAVEGTDPPDMQFNPGGYLTLASETGIQDLMENLDIQRAVGAKVEFLSSKKVKERFPWINTEGIEGGVIGLENEGWFDPWSLLCCLRRKALSLGAHYVTGKLTGLRCRVIDDVITEGIGNMSIQNVNTAEILLPNGQKREINFAIVVVAAGAWSGEVGRMLGIGEGSGIMEMPIPVEPRKRYVYCIHAPDGPGLDCPLVIDPNNTYFRREGLGGMYLCGQSPDEYNEPPIDNLEVDEKFFENNVWPTIANRVPAFENVKLQGSWAGYYDYNTFDQNGIVGLHPLYSNMFIAAGFSGHGIQMAPGVGRAVMECILHGEFVTINLERFGFDRFLVGEPLLERNIV